MIPKLMPTPAFAGVQRPVTRFQGTTAFPSVADQIREERFTNTALEKLRQYAAGQLKEKPEADTVLDLVEDIFDKFLKPVSSHINFHEKAFALMKEVATQGLGPLKPDDPNLHDALPEMMSDLVKKSNVYVQADAVLGYIKEYAEGFGTFKPPITEVEGYMGQIFDNYMGNRGYLNGCSKREPEKALNLIKTYAALPGARDPYVGALTARLVKQINYWVANTAATSGYPDKGKLTPLEVIQAYGDGMGNTKPDGALVGHMLNQYVDAGKQGYGFKAPLIEAITAYGKGFKHVPPNPDLVGQLMFTLLDHTGDHRLVDLYNQGIGQVQPNPTLALAMKQRFWTESNELQGGL